MDKWGNIILNKWGRCDKIHQPRCGPLGLLKNVEKRISTFLLVSFSCGLWLNLRRLSFFICKSVFSGLFRPSCLVSPRPPKSEASPLFPYHLTPPLPPPCLISRPSPSLQKKGPEKDLCFGAGPIAPNLHVRARKKAPPNNGRPFF